MFAKLQNRLTRGSLLVVYFLATATAGLFHDHRDCCSPDVDGHNVCSHAVCDHDHGHALAHASHEHEAVGEAAPLPCQDGLADDDCAVCRFLGLCSLLVAPPPVLASGDLFVAASPAEPIHLALPLARSLHSRAPPQLG